MAIDRSDYSASRDLPRLSGSPSISWPNPVPPLRDRARPEETDRCRDGPKPDRLTDRDTHQCHLQVSPSPNHGAVGLAVASGCLVTKAFGRRPVSVEMSVPVSFTEMVKQVQMYRGPASRAGATFVFRSPAPRCQWRDLARRSPMSLRSSLALPAPSSHRGMPGCCLNRKMPSDCSEPGAACHYGRRCSTVTRCCSTIRREIKER